MAIDDNSKKHASDDDLVAELIKLADRDGVSVSTVSDGHILVFKKSHLKDIVDKLEESGQDKCVVFVKRLSSLN